MAAEAWITLAVVAGTIVVLAREFLPPSATMVGAMVAVMVAGVVTPDEALVGFSNKAPITIAALYVVAKAIEQTGVLEPVVARVLGNQGGIRNSLARLVAPAMVASAVLNNTPIVAMLTPQIEDWSERRGWSPSKFLMPLSFAAILGGSITLIGTATNLVVSGLLDAAGYEPIGFFEISKLGIPVGLVGGTLIVLLAPRLLPERVSPREGLHTGAGRLDIEFVVEPGEQLDGLTVREAGLRNLVGVFLAQVIRSDEVVSPVTPRTRLHGNDRLRFVGKPDDVVELHEMGGLASTERNQVERLDADESAYYEVVIGAGAGLSGKTLREVEFRSRYQAAVIAIHRAGARIDAQLGRVPLRVGDSLLLVADPNFARRWADRTDFLLVSPLRAEPQTRVNPWRMTTVLAVVVAISIALGLPLITGVLVLALGVVASGILSPSDARRSVDLDVIVTIAAAFGLAAAITNSGLADQISGIAVSAFGAGSPLGVLIGIVLATTLLKELVTTNAAALLMFPIAISSALAVGADPRGFAIAVAVAASKSFLTPIGYQTNTMVYGPGGYRYFDYARLGLPITLAVVTLILVIVPAAWP